MKSISITRFRATSFLLTLFTAFSANAAGKDAVFKGYCLSVNLSKGTASVRGISLATYFTTYDGTAAIPLYDPFGNLMIVSNELSPNLAVPGNYRTDYLLFVGGQIDSTGTASANFPTTDNDSNAVPDFLQVERDGTAAFSGTVIREIPSSSPVIAMTGQITRGAGNTSGTYVANIQDPQAGLIQYRGSSFLLNATGKLSYERTVNSATISATVSNEDGTSTDYVGNATFTVTSQNILDFSAMTFSGSNARIVQAKPFRLTRSGKRYLGAVEFQDGGLSTTWRDYISWRLEITDPNDSDGNGVPDLSDTVSALPVINVPPTSLTITEGQPATFSVTATGAGTLTYQWQRNQKNIPLANNSVYSIGNAQLADAGDYRVIVGNPAGSVPSQAAKLTVNPVVIAPNITVQPQNTTATVGQTVKFTFTATGSGPFAYQWRKDNVDLLNGTNADLTISNVSTADNGNYVVVVRNGGGQTTSQPAKLTVNPLESMRLVRLIVLPSNNVDIDVSVNTGRTYQLESSADLKSWIQVQSFTGSQQRMNLRTPTLGASKQFFRLREGAAGPIPPSISTQPQDQIILAGQTASFSVVVEGTGPFSYQWQRNKTSLTGKTLATLTIVGAKASNAGSYRVVVTGPGGTAISDEAVLTVEGQ